jgi:hypothetical protein
VGALEHGGHLLRGVHLPDGGEPLPGEQSPAERLPPARPTCFSPINTHSGNIR